jgi:hypothetical protein
MTSRRAPICAGCTRFHGYVTRTCDAFPEEIPETIWSTETDHRFPFPGDHGIVFEPRTLDDDVYASITYDETDQILGRARRPGRKSATRC